MSSTNIPLTTPSPSSWFSFISPRYLDRRPQDSASNSEEELLHFGCSFKDLCAEVQLSIFNYLEAKDLAATVRVCKLWQALSNDPTLWRPLFARDFPKCDLPAGADARQAYRSRHILYLQPERRVYPSQILYDNISDYKIHNRFSSYILNGKALYLGQSTGEIDVFEIKEQSSKTIRERMATATSFVRQWGMHLIGNSSEKKDSAITCLAYDKKEGNLYSGSTSGTIKAWKAEKGTKPEWAHTIEKAHAAAVTHLTCSEGMLYSASKSDGMLKCWNLKSGTPVLEKTFAGFKPQLNQGGSVFTKGKFFAPIGGEGPIGMYDLQTDGSEKIIGKKAEFINEFIIGESNPIQGITAFTIVEEHLISGSFDGTMAIWDIKKGALLRILPRDNHCKIDSLELTDTGELRVRDGDRIEIWDLNNISTTKNLAQ